MEASIKLSLRHLATLHPAKSRPMTDPQETYAGEKDFDHATAKVVGDKQIWVDQVKLIDKHFEHLSLVLED